MAIRDQSADTSGADLHRFSKLYEFPDFVKSASLENTLRPQGISRTAYADPRSKQFPCHTKAATWVSSLYFENRRNECHPKTAEMISSRLDHYADFWGIRNDLDDLRKKHSELCKNSEEALPDSAFAYVWEGDDGYKVRKCPMRNAVETQKAAAYLYKYRGVFPYIVRHDMAERIVKKANHFGADLHEFQTFLDKQNGRGVCRVEKVADMIRKRSLLTKNPDAKDRLMKLASTVEESPKAVFSPDRMIELCATLDDMDRRVLKLSQSSYSPSIPRPEDVIFEATFKEARAEMDSLCSLTNGSTYDKHDFSKVALDDLRDLFGEDFVEEVRSGLSVDPEKMAEVARTLPRNEADILDSVLSSNGIRPHLKQAELSSETISNAVLERYLG